MAKSSTFVTKIYKSIKFSQKTALKLCCMVCQKLPSLHLLIGSFSLSSLLIMLGGRKILREICSLSDRHSSCQNSTNWRIHISERPEVPDWCGHQWQWPHQAGQLQELTSKSKVSKTKNTAWSEWWCSRNSKKEPTKGFRHPWDACKPSCTKSPRPSGSEILCQ